MKIQKVQRGPIDTSILLSNTKGGDILRFATNNFEDALKTDSFFLRVDAPETKEGRVRLVNLIDGRQIERDGDHRVVVHKTILNIE